MKHLPIVIGLALIVWGVVQADHAAAYLGVWAQHIFRGVVAFLCGCGLCAVGDD